MQMRLYRYILPVVAGLLMLACSNIDESDRYILTESTEIHNTGLGFNQAVLVEDFTGQKCTWCPEGTRILSQLQETYGKTQVIPVAIHSGGLGFRGTSKKVGLMTDLGVYYWEKNGFGDLTSQPTAVFNRKVTTSDRSIWSSTVLDMVKQRSRVTLKGTATLTGDRDLDIVVKAKTPQDTKTYLQLWLIENGIVAMQVDGGETNNEYVHNHVLREAINGNDGEEIALSSEEKTIEHTYTVPEKYVIGNCEVVAFTYDENGVSQAILLEVEQ